MDIEQVKKKKQETEEAIQRLLNEFAEQTGLTVQDVYFDRMHNGCMQFPDSAYCAIKIGVTL